MNHLTLLNWGVNLLHDVINAVGFVHSLPKFDTWHDPPALAFASLSPQFQAGISKALLADMKQLALSLCNCQSLLLRRDKNKECSRIMPSLACFPLGIDCNLLAEFNPKSCSVSVKIVILPSHLRVFQQRNLLHIFLHMFAISHQMGLPRKDREVPALGSVLDAFVTKRTNEVGLRTDVLKVDRFK